MNGAQLQIVITAINNAQSALQQTADQLGGLGTSADNSSKSIGQMFSDMSNSAKIAALDVLPVSAAFDLIEGDLLKQASSAQTATEQGNTLIESTIKNGAASAGSATQIADLTAKLDGYKATLNSAELALSKTGTTAAATQAAHEKASATIAMAEVNINKTQQSLDQLTKSQGASTESASAVETQFQSLADQNTTLGISYEDSYSALAKFVAQTGDAPDALQAYNAAIGLSLTLGEPMATATNQVTQAMNGMGRGVQEVGVHIKDGLSGMQAVGAINDIVGPAATKMKDSLGVQLSGAMENTNKVAATLGDSQIGFVTQLVNGYSNLVNGANDWLKAHQTAAAGISTTFAGLSVGFTGLEGLLGALATAGLAYNGFQAIFIGESSVMASALAIVSAGWAAVATFEWAALLPYVALIAAVILLAAIIIVYHKQIWDEIQYIWGLIVQLFDKTTSWISDHFTQWGGDVTKWWTGLWNGIVTILQGVVGTIMGIINNILSAISKVTGAAGGIIGGAGSAVGGAFQNVVHAFADGGIVTGPTFALVGEAGPEAIIPLSAFNGGTGLAGGRGGGGSGGINIYIQGGSYLDSGGATMIANAIGKQIMQQLKLNNFN